jgi:hypothetical protein
MSGEWGDSKWGKAPWGGSSFVEGPPTITPLDPVNGSAGVSRSSKLQIKFSDSVSVSPSSANVSVNGVIWVLGGVGVNGAIAVITTNDENGFDLVVTPPVPYDSGSQQEVLVTAKNSIDLIAAVVYIFHVGIGLRLLRVANPFENSLIAYLNRPMRLDANFYQTSNWIITPVSDGAKPLTITSVSAYENRSDVAHLKFTGGGSTYSLHPVSIVDQNGEGFEYGYDTVLFEILFGDEPESTVRLFNSIFGPLGISQRTRTRRTMDDHVANRSIALALDEQLRLRMQRIDGTAGRDGRPGKKRT